MIQITREEFKQLSTFIYKNYGIYLKDEKQTLVMGRLQNVLIDNNITSFTDYIKYLHTDKTGEGVATLLNKITTNHTFFMREADHFNYFQDTVLPYLKQAVKDRDLRIWSAGCSSGEEPYTLAMIIDEFLGHEKPLWDAKVLATDISENVLEIGRKGIYKNDEIESLSSIWKINYWKKLNNESSLVNDKIKQEVIFRKFNLINPSFPFKKKFHVIFCRNVMIYFDLKTKRELIRRFYDSLEYGGYLFIGHSESISREETKLKYIMPAVYRKSI